jgi:hypothetical protein
MHEKSVQCTLAYLQSTLYNKSRDEIASLAIDELQKLLGEDESIKDRAGALTHLHNKLLELLATQSYPATTSIFMKAAVILKQYEMLTLTGISLCTDEDLTS